MTVDKQKNFSVARLSVNNYTPDMTGTIIDKPLDIIDFVSLENKQFLVSMANNRQELDILAKIQGLYNAAMFSTELHDNDLVLFQLLTFTHYHFLFSTACLMRCHLSEAFSSARAAIDGALIAAHIIHDRSSQEQYSLRKPPFDKLNRYYKNLIQDNKHLPHHLVPDLIKLHDKFSMFASHADIYSFIHRVSFEKVNGKEKLTINYFQFSTNESERKLHGLLLLHTYILILDVFSDFLVKEQRNVPEDWQTELRRVGAYIERNSATLREQLPPDLQNDSAHSS
jgi:hypothetical protein